jgi:hypothetical protein
VLPIDEVARAGGTVAYELMCAPWRRGCRWYVSARAAMRVAREGWLTVAVRLTWKPLLGALLCAVLLGAVIDRFMPQVNSLPQAVRVLLHR